MQIFAALLVCGIAVSIAADSDWKSAKTMYDFVVKDIDGNEVSLDKYQGHPVLVVNVASKCGLTDTNYRQLNELYTNYRDRGFRIIAFPSNEFKKQEPGCNAEIKEFAKKYDVKFDMMTKIKVNGDDAHPLYKWLKNKQGLDDIEWNFAKFLIDQNGVPIKRYDPRVAPKDIESDVKSLLYNEL
ncbi:unnamed protein product [Oppiella nova]|uniref:Glutathione peroxidase n=1 Tax=Oppiella nova TaxID=334625 RepID=A0A7R9QXZ5_9ACAR|nr:unnamed protein product [Oppiella nova]CAG2178435.1 unnamed protein product [Oppiella nova]